MSLLLLLLNFDLSYIDSSTNAMTHCTHPIFDVQHPPAQIWTDNEDRTLKIVSRSLLGIQQAHAVGMF